MQSVIVIALFAALATWGLMEYKSDDVTQPQIYAQLRADQVACNIIAYNDLVYQYGVTNYESLYQISLSTSDTVAKIMPVWIDDVLQFNQKNFDLFLDYQSITFNYDGEGTTRSQAATLFLATSWNGFNSKRIGHSSTNMLEVMGQVNQGLSKHLYQGHDVDWVVPWVLQQKNCNVTEIYSQIPADTDGNSKLDEVEQIFHQMCLQIEAVSTYRYAEFVYIQPIYRVAN